MVIYCRRLLFTSLKLNVQSDGYSCLKMLQFWWFFIVAAFVAEAKVKFNSWFVKNQNGSLLLPAQVPGGIYSDLMNNKIIEDIHFEYNDIATKWVARENWTYYCNFTVDQDFINNKHINIVFEGLDTFATILINYRQIGQTKNMFVKYAFPIKDLLKIGVNSIEVTFSSPVLVAAELAKLGSYVVPPECPNPAYRGECHVNQIRKMQASFSWDWGPSFPSVGIWKNVSIQSYNTNIIEYLTVDVTDLNSDQWALNLNIYFSNDTNTVIGLTIVRLNLDHLRLVEAYQTNITTNKQGELVHSITITVDKLHTKLWWPNGYGAQPLYDLTVEFNKDSEKSTIKRRVGFRTIELVQEIWGNGLSFYFKINGMPIFMKGSNQIPIDILPEKGQDREKVRKLLLTVKDSHMNMVRVWGGGVYESDYFYDMADELGILIWQDFMFACAMYPADEEFLSNVIDEVQHQVKRLYGHPSIALFAANNENEQALRGNWYNTYKHFKLYKKDFIKLYIDTIMVEFNRVTNNRGIFLSSSPTNGKKSVIVGYISSNPQDNLFGDVHFYNYNFDGLNPNIYPTPRFASEYGYQAFPSVDSLLTVVKNVSELQIDGKFMDHRQHHPGGNSQMKTLIAYQLQLPSENSTNYYKAFIYSGMIIQALSVKVESEHYRSLQDHFDSTGKGRTMGALYWQLNDVWLAPTWSGIDFTGNWKMLQYYVTEFFAPIIVTASINSVRDVTVYGISDSLSTIPNVTFVWSKYKWNATNLSPVSVEEFLIDLEPTSSRSILSQNIDHLLAEDATCGNSFSAKYNCFFSMQLYKNGVHISPLNFLIPAKIKDLSLAVANVQIDFVSLIGTNTFAIKITTDKIALFVWLEAPQIKGRFTENGFIQVTPTKTIYFYNETFTSSKELKRKLTVTHLLDPIYS